MSLLKDWLTSRELFLTHTPDGFRVGEYWVNWNNGKRFRITRITETSPTALYCGGSVCCYSVRGVLEPKETK